MKLQCLGSSSNGNCYLLTDSHGRTLVIEAGIRPDAVKQALGWRMDGVTAAVVSHSHIDHARYLPAFMRAGIQAIAPRETFAERDCYGIFAEPAKDRKATKAGPWHILPLAVEHDVPCMAYVISHAELGRLLFATDTPRLPYRIAGITHYLIEANYADDILDGNIAAGRVPLSQRERLLNSHMEIRETIAALTDGDGLLSDTQDITLIHLSDRNSDAERFRQQVAEATGKPVRIATAGMSWDLGVMPY